VTEAPATGRTPIRAGSRVTLHFTLMLADGREVDSTRRGRPATFVVGDGRLPPGVERALMGLEAGADERIALAPDDAFGAAREENVRMIPRAQFASTITLEPGVVVSFAGPGGELPGVVSAIEGDLVVVDFNHPLAGRDLILDVTVLAVAPVPA
jgi:FKBP-type peptidyl-prolyl cis-trans isomerase SlpA